MVRTLLTAARLILYHYLWKRESSLKCSIPSMCPPLNNTSCICHDSRHAYNKPSNMRNISISNVYLYIKSINLQIYIFIIQIWTFIIISVPSYGFLRWSVCQQRPASVPPICLLFVPCSKMTASSIVNKYTKDVIGG